VAYIECELDDDLFPLLMFRLRVSEEALVTESRWLNIDTLTQWRKVKGSEQWIELIPQAEVTLRRPDKTREGLIRIRWGEMSRGPWRQRRLEGRELHE
jgi:hypothetical protein